MEPFPHHYSRRPKPDVPMDSNFRLMLDELQQMEARLSDRIDGRCSGLERRVVEVEQKAEERLVSLEMSRTEAELGRAELEKQFDGLRLEVGRLNCFMERESMLSQQGKPGIFSTNEAASSPFQAGGDSGEAWPRRADLLPQPAAPRGGASQPRSRDGFDFVPELARERHMGDSLRANQGRLPKISFPVFSGEDPQLWRSKCENYFDMYGVESSLWVRVATMHLEGTAARWLQSHERQVKQADWNAFCSMIHDRFGRDQHEALIR
jgi:hypothetical protein